ncbi:PREDICTED: E3 ubiquitin-protein ligase Praja-2, partial [Mesitornis unicolor]|uniref:E3 ubiquitin-protein ligase Praja-2 n=1 Tax=Mesitornis unicolor TaxID=54374 RepID=UPI00052924FB
FCEGSSPMVQVSSGLLNDHFLENIGSGVPICQTVSSQNFEVSTSLSLFSYGLEGNQISGNFMNAYEKCDDLAEYASGGHNDLNGQNGIAFVNIDSYEPDSSDGEEDDAQDKFSLAREAAGVFPETLDNMVFELEKGVESFADLQFQLSALTHSVSSKCCKEAELMPLMRYFSIDSDLAGPNNRAFTSSADDQAILRSRLSGANYETQQIENTVDDGIRSPIAIADELYINYEKTDEEKSLELVVRPKIRKQNTANQLERKKLLPNDDEEESDSWRRIKSGEVQQAYAECVLRNSKEEMSSNMLFESEYQGHQKHTEIVLRKDAAVQEQNVQGNSTFWDELEECTKHFSVSHKDEDSSECSDGEWSTGVPMYFTAAEKDQSSSDESWETVSGREEREPEVQSSSSGVEEESTDFYFQGGERMLLEEGEICWLQYREEGESSSDEGNDPISDFVHPGFFLLDGNNNLEDDSSVSEDLDVEWRLLDEFGDGLGLAQAIPYADPQFLTFMSLEEHLQAAMEIALAHLESLVFEVDQ